jgi:hypothetical protein
MPGAVPDSASFLGQTDNEGNELWRLTCVRDYSSDYMRVLRQKGFVSQQFDFDIQSYNKNQQLYAQLKVDYDSLSDKI